MAFYDTLPLNQHRIPIANRVLHPMRLYNRLFNMIAGLLGTLILTGMTLAIFALSLFVVIDRHFLHPLTLLKIITLAVLLIEMVHDFKQHIVKDIQNMGWGIDDLGSFLGVLCGAFTTFLLSTALGLGPVVSAGLVGVLASMLVKRYDAPVYCGAFVGMSCPTYIHGNLLLILAAFLAGILFLLSKESFKGFGGKLGTIAFAGCIGSGMITGRICGSNPVPDWELGKFLVFYAVSGAVLTYVLSIRFRHSPVISSGYIGLLGGIILPVIHPDTGRMLAVVVICASFAGMSNTKRIPNELYLLAAGALCAIIYMYCSPHLEGAGGKLGTIAFGSVIAVAGMRRVALRLYHRTKKLTNKRA